MSRQTERGPPAQPSPRTRQRGMRHARRRPRRRPRHGELAPIGDTGTAFRPGSDHDPLQPVPGHRAFLAAYVSLLFGMAAAMSAAALIARFRSVWTDGIAVKGTVVAIVLVALATGVRVPQRFAMWVCLAAWNRFVSRGQRSEISELLVESRVRDLPFDWVVLSVIALGAGVATALIPLGMRVTLAVDAWMHAHFVWSAAPHVVLQAATVFATGLVPLATLGLAMSFAHRLSSRRGTWDTRATAWLLIGTAAGLLISAALSSARGMGELMLISASLPALLASLLSAARGSSRRGSPAEQVDHLAATLPISSDRWPTLLRASIVAVGGGGVCAISVWAGHVGTAGNEINLSVPAMLAAAGIGVLVGCRAKQSGLRSIGGFGMACVWAGAVVGVGSIAATGVWSIGPGQAAVIACAGLAAVGFATAYGRQTLLHRVASRSYAGATILTRLLVCAAFAVAVAAPLAVHLVGGPATLVILALSLAALGGTLIIHEPRCSVRTRRLRLVAVLCTIVVMILASLSPSSPWQRKRAWRPAESSGERPGTPETVASDDGCPGQSQDR